MAALVDESGGGERGERSDAQLRRRGCASRRNRRSVFLYGRVGVGLVELDGGGAGAAGGEWEALDSEAAAPVAVIARADAVAGRGGVRSLAGEQGDEGRGLFTVFEDAGLERRG